MKKEKTTLKPIRIPDSVIDEIEEVAATEGSDFSKIANYRLKHFESLLTPAKIARIQNASNKVSDTYGVNPITQKLSEEVADLWNFLN